MNKALFAATALLILASCGPDLSNVPQAEFGLPPTGNIQPVIENFMELGLIDPESARYTKIGGPVQGWTREALLKGGTLEVGWAECWLVNAKNRFGGFTGNHQFLFLFRGNRIVGMARSPELSSWNCWN